ncbi:MAG: porin [Holosporales bacterium]|nr:porin [Holosporales bacterium]
MCRWGIVLASINFSFAMFLSPVMAETTQPEIQEFKTQLETLETHQAAESQKCDISQPHKQKAVQCELQKLKNRLAALEAHQAVSEQKVHEEQKPRPGYFLIPGMKSDAKVWASVRMQIIHDLNNSVEYGAGYDLMHVTSIPLYGNDKHLTRAHLKETRYGIETLTPAQLGGKDTVVRLFLECDFFGAQDLVGGENTTNQALLRVRHVYVEYGPLIIGQYWGAFCDHNAFFDGVDFSPPVGGVSLRSPQIRYTHHVGDDLHVIATIENPEGECLDTNGKANFTKANGRYSLDQSSNKAFNNLVVDQCPDIGFSVVFDKQDKGHFSFRSALRHLHTKKSEKKSDVIGAVAGIGGVLKIFKDNEINAQINGGRGGGRYMFEIGGTGAFLDTDSKLHAQHTVGGMLAYKHFWGKSIWSDVGLGYIYIKNHDYLRRTKTQNPVNRELRSLNVNLHWRPSGFENMRIGTEYIWGQRKTEMHGSASLSRVMIGVKTDF